MPRTTCGITDITSDSRGALTLWRCDREDGHDNQHHAEQDDHSEMFWFFPPRQGEPTFLKNLKVGSGDPAPVPRDPDTRLRRQAHLAYLFLNVEDCPKCHLPSAQGYVCPCGYDGAD